jgi:hypothetical protein
MLENQMPLSGVAPLARFLVQQARHDLPRLILVYIKYRLNLDPVGRKPALDVVDVFGPERIEKTASIDSIALPLRRYGVVFQSVTVDRHVAVAQAKASVDKSDEQLARRLFRREIEACGKPFVQRSRKARAPCRAHRTRTLATSQVS